MGKSEKQFDFEIIQLISKYLSFFMKNQTKISLNILFKMRIV